MIRHMTNDDIQRVGEIWLEASIKAHLFVCAEFWRSKLAEMTEKYLPGADGYVYTAEQGIHGFAVWQGNFIHCLFVEPTKQSGGIGTALLQRMKADHEALELKVYQENVKAIRFYETHGFVVTDSGVCEHTGCAELTMAWKKTPNKTGGR